MRNLFLAVLAVVLTAGLGSIFVLPSVSTTVTTSYGLPFGWKSSGACPKNAEACIPNNICIAPIATPKKGIPLQYQRANDTVCLVEKNVLAEVADWLLYAVISFAVVGMIGKLIGRGRNGKNGSLSYA